MQSAQDIEVRKHNHDHTRKRNIVGGHKGFIHTELIGECGKKYEEV